MSDQVFYFRGSFPGGTHHQIEPEMVADLKAAAAVPRNILKVLASELLESQEFLSRRILGEKIARHFSDKVLADAIARVFWNLSGKNEEAKNILEALAEWRAESDENKALLSNSDLDGIQEVFSIATTKVAGIEKWKKASRITNLTGVKLDDIQIVCDFRPVFDEERKTIEAIIPTTTLHLAWETTAGFPAAIDVQLNQKQIQELAQKISQLEQKLLAMNVFAKSHKIIVPEIDRIIKSDAK